MTVERINDITEIQFPRLGWTFHIDPTAFSVVGIDIPWSGILIVSGLLLALLYVLPRMKRFGLDADRAIDAIIGGVIGGIIGGWIWCKIRKLDFMAYFDLMIPVVALAQGFGRIGCFFAGCCYGKETTGFGVVFPHGSLAPSGVKLIPTQLISSFGDFVLFFFLIRVYNDPEHRDETAAWYLILYSLGRFMVEFLRGDEIRGFIMGLSTSQFISIFMFIAGIILLAVRRKSRKQPELTGA